MFTTLHELAKKATLMITVAAEGDGQLRVNVTPMPFDTKAKSNLPQPLSLLATPTEFDADFIAALSTWQAPKRSLVQQAQDAVGGTSKAAAAPALPAPKADTKNEAKTEKSSRKARAGKGGEDDKKVDAVPGAAAAAGEAVAGADQVMADTAGANASDQLPDSVPGDGSDAEADANAAADEQVDDANASALAAGQEASAMQPATADEPADKFTLELF